MIGQRTILTPSGEAAAVGNGLEEQLIVHQCALDFGYRYEEDIFNFFGSSADRALPS